MPHAKHKQINQVQSDAYNDEWRQNTLTHTANQLMAYLGRLKMKIIMMVTTIFFLFQLLCSAEALN